MSELRVTPPALDRAYYAACAQRMDRKRVKALKRGDRRAAIKYGWLAAHYRDQAK